MEIKIAGKSSVQTFLDSYSPPACPLSSVKILPGPLGNVVAAGDLSCGYTNLCTEPLQGLPAINMPPVQHGDLQHIPACRLHALRGL